MMSRQTALNAFRNIAETEIKEILCYAIAGLYEHKETASNCHLNTEVYDNLIQQYNEIKFAMDMS